MGKPLTVTLPDDRYQRIVDMVESEDVASKSEAVNQLIESGEHANRLEARNNELENKLSAANAENNRVNELAEYVEEEQSLQRIERRKQNAPLIQRVKWILWGYDND